jgi:hypothetical protein
LKSLRLENDTRVGHRSQVGWTGPVSLQTELNFEAALLDVVSSELDTGVPETTELLLEPRKEAEVV